MLISLLLIIILLACSALVSSAEVAYFSLSTTDMQELENNKGRTSKLALQLLELPKKLLATILIANNFVNVSIIILSTFLTKNLIDAEAYPFLFGFVELVVVTFLLLLIGEVIPKVYATKYALKTTTLMAYPLKTLRGVFSPLSSLLISSTVNLQLEFSIIFIPSGFCSIILIIYFFEHYTPVRTLHTFFCLKKV